MADLLVNVLIPTSGGALCHQAVSTFEFLHNYCFKSSSKAYRGGGMYVLKGSSPLCCGLLHLFLVSMFGIVSFLSGVKEICQIVCLRATSKGEHNLM
jgi:hypothetical protein